MSTETWLLLGLLVFAPAYCWAVGWAQTPVPCRPRIVRNGAVLFLAILVALSAVIGVTALGVLYTSYGWWFLAVCVALSIFSAWSALPPSERKSDEQMFFELDEPAKPTTSEADKIIQDVQSNAVKHSIKMGDLKYVRMFIRTHPRSLNYLHPPDYFTLLHLIASLGAKTRPVHAKMAKELLVNGADVNCRTVLGRTPIHIIARHGQKEACDLARLLIAHGADLMATDTVGLNWRMHWQHGIEIRRVLERSK